MFGPGTVCETSQQHVVEIFESEVDGHHAKNLTTAHAIRQININTKLLNISTVIAVSSRLLKGRQFAVIVKEAKCSSYLSET